MIRYVWYIYMRANTISAEIAFVSPIRVDIL